ncbi:uncharacterized protein VP01_1874g1 [Puccinia sorghi]|uniref:Uncharacterized protein n=1 Tax=Puccinia sorghi TaxID=27349 RepID=A0A0L6VDB5_9BASI|nr:uncharacterized protein VP01_1874g1 [Puccinia sorghi]
MAFLPQMAAMRVYFLMDRFMRKTSSLQCPILVVALAILFHGFHQSAEQACVTLTQEEADYKSAEFQLKQSKMVNTNFVAINELWTPENILLGNGNNSCQCTRKIQEVESSIVLVSVHHFLILDLQHCEKVHVMHSTLKKKLSSAPHTFQINIWHLFMLISVEMTGWKCLNVRIYSDSFFSFILQAALSQFYLSLNKDFEHCVGNLAQKSISS